MTENTDVNANFLDADWWKTATVEDIEAEIAKGADVNAMDVKIMNFAIDRIKILIDETKYANFCIEDISDKIGGYMSELTDLNIKITELEETLIRKENAIKEQEAIISSYYIKSAK